MRRSTGAVNRRNGMRWKILTYASLAFGGVILVCAFLFLAVPNPLLQGFVENRLTEEIGASLPEYSMRLSGFRIDVLKNRIACDAVTLIRNDSSFSCRVDSLSVRGIDWLALLRGSGIDSRSMGGSVIEAGNVDAELQPSGYSVRSGRVRISVADSALIAENLEIYPAVSDEKFFAASRFRETRIDFRARTCSISGLGCVELLGGKNMRARSVQLRGVAADILINKDKPPGTGPPGPRMPSEFLAALDDTVLCDSLELTDGNLRYAERMATGRNPATLTFGGMHVVFTGIAGRPGRYAESAVSGTGQFVGGGTMDVAMSIPLAGPPGSFRYSGSLSGMDLGRLNSFIEISDDMRIKSGTLESAAFDIDVHEGSATGTVHALYRNLVIASINDRTGSEGGVLDRFSSWIAKNISIRGTNSPGRSGALKIGKVKYIRKRTDPFLGFTWFALRSGVGDVVGF
jgi:hypothetical protein